MVSFGGQEVKGQGHTRSKIDLEAWQRHCSGPPLGHVAFLVVSFGEVTKLTVQTKAV